MIASHKHRFIFIKTEKTAGTSIEIALSRHCGEDDIISRISPEDQATRAEVNGRGPQHDLAPLEDYRFRDLGRVIKKRRWKQRFYHHMSAHEVRQHLGSEIWDQYYTFGFTRNPWDRLVSHYYWKFKTEPRPTIMEFIESDAALSLRRRGLDLLTLDGEIAVDRVCRFENIAEEMETIRQRVDIPEAFELPRAKSRFRKDKRSYQEILGEPERNRIAELFQEEIERFGYEF